MPFQFNYNGNFLPEDGDQYFVNIQPVIPISISGEWNLISRTILPIVSQDDVAIGEQRVQIGGGLRYWVTSPDFGPQDWGARLTVTFLFPRV